MSKEKKLHSRLEQLFAGLSSHTQGGQPAPSITPAAPERAAQPAPDTDPLAAVPGWTWETDAAGMLTVCAEAVTQHLGFAPAELIGRPLTSLLDPGDEAGRRELAEAFTAQRPLLDQRLALQAKDGQRVVVVASALPNRDEGGQFVGLRGVSQVLATPALPDRPADPVVDSQPPAPPDAPPPTPAPQRPKLTGPLAGTKLLSPLPAARLPGTAPLPSLPGAARPGTAPLPAAGQRNNGQASPSLPSWGYLADENGFKPIGSWTSTEIEAALAYGRLVLRGQGPSLPGIASAPAGPGRALAVPIRLQNQTIGVLDFFDEEASGDWSEDDVALVQAVADQLALALENARLFNETREYLTKQTLLYEVTRAAASAANLSDALRSAAEALARVLPEVDIAILLLDETGRNLRIRAAVGYPADLSERLIIKVGQGITGWVAQHNQPVLVPDVRLDPRYVPGISGMVSEAAVPLALGERVIGVLNVESPRAGAFDEQDLQLLSTLAGTLSAIIVNNNLLEEISRERERLAVLYDVLQALLTRPSRQAIFETAVSMAPRLGAQHAYLALFGARPQDSDFHSNLPGLDNLAPREAGEFAYTLSRQGLEQWVIVNRRAAVVHDTLADERWYVAPSHREAEPARSVIAVPLQTQRGTITGVLAYTHAQPGALTAEHLPLIESIAGQVAVALENEQLRRQQQVQSYNAEALARAAQAMTRTLSEAELHEIVAEQLLETFRPNGVAVLGWEPGTNTFTPRAVRIAPNETEADRSGWPAPGQSFSVARRPDLLDVIQARQGRIRVLREEPDDQLRESMALPLLYGGDVEGVVEVVHTGDRHGLSPADLELFQSILTAAASALQSARLYELQRQTAERLAEVDRLKSQFLANMSHELRTPLNSIIGFSRVILKGIDGPLTELQAQDLASIHNAGQHLLGLINDILDLARIEAGKMELVLDEIDLNDVVKGVLSTTVALVKDKRDKVELREEVAPNLPRVRADAMRVRQVLLNLLSNAAKFTDQGSITLRVRPVEAVSPRTGLVEPFVELSVIDTGPGIAPEDMQKLFERFSQVDASATRKVGGSGLGLSICRQLVELHNGRIWVESEVGQGSTFTFILPVSQPEPEMPDLTLDAESGESQRLVLAVDDDPGIISLYRRFLEPNGYRVVGLTKSAETITRAAELRPIAILLDVLMPNRDGWQVLADLKRSEITRDIPVIVCTLVSDPERARAMGAAAYLPKPILDADLLRALNRLPARGPQAPPGAEVGRPN